MNLTERDEEIQAFFKAAFQEIVRKGKDYEPSGVAFENLKKEAEDMGVTPLKFLLIHASKHCAALKSYVEKGTLESEEHIHSRLLDLANYAALFHTLIVDQNCEKLKYENDS